MGRNNKKKKKKRGEGGNSVIAILILILILIPAFYFFFPYIFSLLNPISIFFSPLLPLFSTLLSFHLF